MFNRLSSKLQAAVFVNTVLFNSYVLYSVVKLIFVTHLLINPSCQEWMIDECFYSWCHSPLLLPLRFYSLVWIITVTNSSCSQMAFWIEREGESAREREAATEKREAWEINSSELTLRGPGTAEYCSSGGEMGRWREARGKKNPYAAREMNLMISGGRGEDHHSLLLTIKIRLASTVSTLASVKAWQGREGGQPPVGVWEFAMWTMETPQCLSLTAQASKKSTAPFYWPAL